MSTVRFDKWRTAANGQEVTHRGVAKTWANLNGTGVIALRDSLNISGVVDNGTADYTINFTSLFADINYTPATSSSPNFSNVGLNVLMHAGSNALERAPLVDSIRLETRNSGNSFLFDSKYIGVIITGNLAV